MAGYGSKRASSGAPQNTQAKKQESTLSKILNFELTPSKPSPKNLTVPQADLLVFFRQLSVVLQSGVPLAQGLELLSENVTNKNFGDCIYDISKELSAGNDLSSSLKKYPKVFKPIMVGLIEAGEAGGILSKVLERIALLVEAQAKLKGEITGALIYPVLVLVLAISVSLGLLIFIVPKFKTMFDGMGAELPSLTNWLLITSQIVTTPGFAIGAPVAVFTFVFLFRGFYSNKEGRLIVDKLILQIPLFGDLILRSEMAAMSDTLSTLTNAGIPLVEGIDRCIGACSNEVIRRALRNSISLIEQGQELSYALSLAKSIPRLFISMVKIGEETGALAFMLDNLANFYKREVEETVSKLTKAMEPMIIFVVAGIVGTIVIALYLPMFSLIQNVG